MAQTAFLIYHGTEDGNREDCNIFHEVPEVYLDRETAETRKTELDGLYADVPCGFVHMKERPVGEERDGRWNTGD